MDKAKLTNEAKRQRNLYMQKWRAENKDKVQKHQATYWNKKASEVIEAADDEE